MRKEKRRYYKVCGDVVREEKEGVSEKGREQRKERGSRRCERVNNEARKIGKERWWKERGW